MSQRLRRRTRYGFSHLLQLILISTIFKAVEKLKADMAEHPVRDKEAFRGILRSVKKIHYPRHFERERLPYRKNVSKEIRKTFKRTFKSSKGEESGIQS